MGLYGGLFQREAGAAEAIKSRYVAQISGYGVLAASVPAVTIRMKSFAPHFAAGLLLLLFLSLAMELLVRS